MQSERLAETPAASPRGSKTAGIVAGASASAVVAAGMISRTSDTSRAQAWSDARSSPTVHPLPVRGPDANGQPEPPGTMAAWNTAHIFARVPGYVRSWDRDIGAAVGSGTPSGRIDTSESDQQIVAARASSARARAGAGLARSTAVRWNDSLTDHSVSQQEADEKNGNSAVQVATVR
ncbi:hypothetical protein OY671_009564, partial [Metschnikowia pulcherrima]